MASIVACKHAKIWALDERDAGAHALLKSVLQIMAAVMKELQSSRREMTRDASVRGVMDE